MKEACCFPDAPRASTYQVKHLIASEIKAEKMLQEILTWARDSPQVDRGPPGAERRPCAEKKGAQPSTPRSQEPCLERILKRAVMEEKSVRDCFPPAVESAARSA